MAGGTALASVRAGTPSRIRLTGTGHFVSLCPARVPQTPALHLLGTCPRCFAVGVPACILGVPNPIRSMHSKSLTPFLLGLLVSGVFLWVALRGTEFSIWSHALVSADFFLLIPFLLFLAGFYWLKAVRWRMLLTPVYATSAGEILPALMVGFAGNNLLPAHLGELLRMHLLGQQLQISQSAVFGSIVLERTLDIMTLVTMLTFALLWQRSIIPELQLAALAFAGAGILLLLATVSLLRYSGPTLRFTERCTAFLPDRLQSALLHQVECGVLGISSIRRPELWLGLAATSVAQWMLLAGCIGLSLEALNIQVPWTASVIILALTVVGITLPSAPGFFGTIQLCFILALDPFGVNTNEAFAAAIYYHITIYLAVTATGLAFLRQFRLRLRSLRALVAAARASRKDIG
jgi:glycosyltransferase 2 family protein